MSVNVQQRDGGEQGFDYLTCAVRPTTTPSRSPNLNRTYQTSTYIVEAIPGASYAIDIVSKQHD